MEKGENINAGFRNRKHKCWKGAHSLESARVMHGGGGGVCVLWGQFSYRYS